MPRTMWIDAICMNQKDHAERAAQVAWMVHVYARAEKVLVWPGREFEEGEQSWRNRSAQLTLRMGLLSRRGLSRNRKPGLSSPRPQSETSVDTRERSSIPETFKFVEELAAVLQSNPSESEKMICSEPGLKFVMTLHDLMFRPSFHRLWVVQEVTVAKKAGVVCGNHLVPWFSLNRAVSSILTIPVSHLHQLLDGFAAQTIFSPIYIYRLSMPSLGMC
jgi:hypothetical protein